MSVQRPPVRPARTTSCPVAYWVVAARDQNRQKVRLRYQADRLRPKASAKLWPRIMQHSLRISAFMEQARLMREALTRHRADSLRHAQHTTEQPTT